MVRIFLAPSNPVSTCSEEEKCDHNVLYFNGFTLANVSGSTKWTICLLLDIYYLETRAPLHMFPRKTSIGKREGGREKEMEGDLVLS